MISLFFWGCGEESGQTSAPVAETVLMAQVESPKVSEGEPIQLSVSLNYDADIQNIAVQPPQAAGMLVSLLEGPSVEHLGRQHRQRWNYSLTAPSGSYVIYPGEAQVGEEAPITAHPIFIDIAVQGPVSELAALVEPPPASEPVQWRWPLTITGLGIGVFGLLFWVYRRQQPLPEDPVQVARSAWQGVKTFELSEHQRAVELSLIVRRYLVAMTNEPVLLSLSPSELQDWLSTSPSTLAQTKELGKLLRELDGFKFSHVGGGEDWWSIQEDRFQSVLEPSSSLEQR